LLDKPFRPGFVGRVIDRDRGPGFGESPGDCRAYALRGAGDDRHFPTEFAHGHVPYPFAGAPEVASAAFEDHKVSDAIGDRYCAKKDMIYS
jgi:hypothetical protein